MDEKQCWYLKIDGKFKVKKDIFEKYEIHTDVCVQCKYPITSLSYQQNYCGSRYCQDCYSKLKHKYYCKVCIEEDSNNFVHKIDNVFEDKALKKDLERMSIRCPDCESEMKLINLEDHVDTKCNNGWKECNKCHNMTSGSFRHECPSDKIIVTASSSTICHDCNKELGDFEDHHCKIKCGELCKYGCSLEGVSMEKHSKDEALFHLDRSWAILKELQMTDCKRHDESPEYTEWLELTMGKLKGELGYNHDNVKTLKEHVAALNKVMEEEKAILEDIKLSLLNSTSDLQSTCFDGTIMWRLDNFSKLKENAGLGIQKSIFSQPFYTSRFGYKMCLRLYPNGDSTAKGVAMSLFLVILKGNYDAILRWPFKQKVTFMLMDYELKEHWKDEFSPSDSMASFSRPSGDMNIPAGNSYFIKFDEMNRKMQRYARGDIVFIRCIVDCSDLLE